MPEISRFLGIVVGVTAALIVVFGILPNPVLWWARGSVVQGPIVAPAPQMAPAMDGTAAPIAAVPR